MKRIMQRVLLMLFPEKSRAERRREMKRRRKLGPVNDVELLNYMEGRGFVWEMRDVGWKNNF